MRKLGIESIIEQQDRLDILVGENVNIEVENIINLQNKMQHNVRIIQGPPERILIKLNTKNILKYIMGLLEILEGKQ